MRTRLMVLGMGFCLLCSGNAVAQSKRGTPKFGATPARGTFRSMNTARSTAAAHKVRSPREAMIRAANAARLIQKRAMRQAQQRRARIEARNWLGISLLRPNLPRKRRFVRGWNDFNGSFDWNYSLRLRP